MWLGTAVTGLEGPNEEARLFFTKTAAQYFCPPTCRGSRYLQFSDVSGILYSKALLLKVWPPDQQPPSTPPGSSLEKHPFRTHPRPAESESTLSQDHQVVLWLPLLAGSLALALSTWLDQFSLPCFPSSKIWGAISYLYHCLVLLEVYLVYSS